MQVKWTAFLTKLGCTITNPTTDAMQPCPLHPDVGNTLRITRDACDPAQGAWHFTCTESRCNFNGDAVILLSKVRKISMDEAFSLFLPGQEFASTLEEDFTGAQLDEYRNSKSNQLRISEYILRAQDAIRQAHKGMKLRNKMATFGASQYSSHTLNDVPKTLGLLIPEDLPAVLRELKPHSKAHCALYPYTYNGQVTHVRVQNFDEEALPSHTVTILRKDVGMFMENNITENTKELFAATSEIICCNLYQKYSEYSSQPPALVALAGLPLPGRFRNIERLSILPSKEYKLSLTFALHLFSAPEVIEGCPDKKVSIHVGPEGRVLDAFPIHTLEQIPGKHGHVTELLVTWIVRKISKLIADKDVEAVYRAFESNNLSEAHRKELVEKATALSLPPETIQLLDTLGQLPNSTLRLANGREIRQTPTGMLAVGLNGDEHRISNVAISIDECVVTRSDEIKYMCKLRSDIDTPPIVVILRSKDFNTAASLRTAVHSEFLKQGQSVYPAFYEQARFGWPDILAKLSEGKNVRQEIETLGVNSGRIHFPHFTLNTLSKKVEHQHQVFTLDSDILQLYSGLRYDASIIDSTTTMRKLVAGAEGNPYIAGFLFGLCHIVYNLVAALLRTENKVKPVPQHLLYVEPEPGTWTAIYLQLCQLFADVDEIPRMPGVKTAQYLPKLTQLGSLPCMQILPGVSCGRFKQILADLEVNMISIVDSHGAAALTGDSRISFVDSPNYLAREVYSLNTEDIAALQASLPGILLELTTKVLTPEEKAEFRNAEIPALAGYHLLCRTLGMPVNAAMEKQVKHYYADNGISCIYTFMHALKALIDDSECPIKVVNGIPTTAELERSSPPEAFVMDDCICLGHHAVRLVNGWRRRGSLFSVPSLNMDFERYQHMYPTKHFEIDRNRYWVLDRDIWNKYIVGVPIVLRVVTNGNVIQLPRMIA